LDTRLKSSKSKYIISSIILLVLVIFSVGMYSTYPMIKEQAKKYEYNVFERSDFLNDISNSNYGIYFNILKGKEANNLEPSDVLLAADKKNDNRIEQDLQYAANRFNEDIYRFKRNLDFNFKNLEYYAIKKDSKLIEERNTGGISILLNDNIDSKDMEALNNKYSFYMVVDYNDNGVINIKRSFGADKSILDEQFKNMNNVNMRNSYSNNVEIQPIKNMTYVYAVPRELQYKDMIVNYKNRTKINSYKDPALNFTTIGFLCIALVGLIIPYKISRELIGFKTIAKLPIEISGLLIFTALVIICDDLSYSIISSTISGDLIDLSVIGASSAATYALTDIANILYWTMVFGIVFIGTMIIKHILSTGIIKYLKENSLIYKILRSIWRSNKRVYTYIRSVDLRSKENKRLVLLLGINFILLSIMSAMWFLGIIAAVIYTVILFKLITKHYNDIGNKYNKLFEATNKIAEGNLDVNIEEDLGVFNSFKVELQSIQKGFKKAVNEEVKSQRMKTELITNVSHDLKTPLTSIITYVDLLKDENLSVEKRREYLDTLDRKSQRLKELIEDLFEVSKATSGNISLNIVEVDVVSLIKQTLLELEDKIAEASLIVKTNYPEEKVILPLDSQRMFRVFENLIINITKYAMSGTRVYIDVIDKIDKIEITLKNMAANEINFNVDDIMERFVRGDKARNTEGAGLGLAIANSFVELQGGKLNINVDGDLFKVIITIIKNN
jgi:signal transduction histidine kinase